MALSGGFYLDRDVTWDSGDIRVNDAFGGRLLPPLIVITGKLGVHTGTVRTAFGTHRLGTLLDGEDWYRYIQYRPSG
jgi:hypothetical protein